MSVEISGDTHMYEIHQEFEFFAPCKVIHGSLGFRIL